MTPETAQYMALAQELMRRCYAEEDGEMLRSWLGDQLARMGAADESALLTWPASFDYYDELLAQRERDAMIPPDQRKVLDWGWDSWNRLIDPLDPGMLAVVSAGDGMGKTIYAECLAEHWANKKNRVVFIHYELNRALMLDRRTARHTGIPRRNLKSGQLTQDEKRRIAFVRPKLLAWEGCISYLHTPGWTMEKTVTEMRRLKAEGLCDVVVLDYLEKTGTSRRQLQMFGSNPNSREADNVEQLKNFAESTETPVLMLAQMSKAGKSQSFDNLDRTDMRGAGEKSEKANIVVLLHREKDKDRAGEYSPIVNVRVDKNTVGATGNFTQYMHPECFSVHDLEAE